jgi:hypothetical protein
MTRNICLATLLVAAAATSPAFAKERRMASLGADTNMTYAVKYLAGAYQVAGGNHTRAVHYYAAGYYYAAKRKGLAARADTGAASGIAIDGNGGVARINTVATAKPSARLREALAEGASVSSSSSLYSGRLDYH